MKHSSRVGVRFAELSSQVEKVGRREKNDEIHLVVVMVGPLALSCSPPPSLSAHHPQAEAQVATMRHFDE